MKLSDYTNELTARQRLGLITGVPVIALATIFVSAWLLRDADVLLEANASSERLSDLSQALDRAKLNYRIGDGGDAVWVAQSQLGKARAAVAAGHFDTPPTVGLELFKEADFSTTDFAQRINYQRALQGELTRTIQTMVGVRSARVHVILPDSGLFRREESRASAAVSVAMQPGKLLSVSQVRGIQRLVAASVPEIKAEEVVVLDESGASLTRAGSAAPGEMSSAQLDLKRQADQYLANKLSGLLQELMPDGVASVSVDAVLEERQVHVTTDEPIGAHKLREADRETGILVKERQSQGSRESGGSQNSSNDAESEGGERELEYQVGHRLEQASSGPGSIKRLSVAVALQGAPAELSTPAVEQLVSNAVGVDRSRGDSVTVLLLPVTHAASPAVRPSAVAGPASQQRGLGARPDVRSKLPTYVLAAAAAVLVLLVLAFVRQTRSRIRYALPGPDPDLDALTVKIRQWLGEGINNGRS